MRTAFLNDQQIRPTDFHRWSHARRQFDRPGKDRTKVEDLKASIPQHGLLRPITLGVSDRYPDVYVCDGHHRAVALLELHVAWFPFHWYWIKASGVRMEREPFPFHLLGLNSGPAVATGRTERSRTR
ncbi:ParB N-terminal domain-containing protein [Streptomyces sviceus]|uniref:ParB N-terminal domain-containing protein n=1 Tax=Streptomyces sviceus TaxID=285530 RepID=UPI00381150DB